MALISRSTGMLKLVIGLEYSRIPTRYGGMWKNKHKGVSAKKPKHKSRMPPKAWVAETMSYVNNDRVTYDNKLWICRRSHHSDEKKTPENAYRYWKEVDSADTD